MAVDIELSMSGTSCIFISIVIRTRMEISPIIGIAVDTEISVQISRTI